MGFSFLVWCHRYVPRFWLMSEKKPVTPLLFLSSFHPLLWSPYTLLLWPCFPVLPQFLLSFLYPLFVPAVWFQRNRKKTNKKMGKWMRRRQECWGGSEGKERDEEKNGGREGELQVQQQKCKQAPDEENQQRVVKSDELSLRSKSQTLSQRRVRWGVFS